MTFHDEMDDFHDEMDERAVGSDYESTYPRGNTTSHDQIDERQI